MSDQKIWFIYLTDHHEGPFTAQEIAEKAAAGLVSGQSLAWKDGMAEWVPAETIPELQAAMAGNSSGGAEPQIAPDSIESGGASLASLLAQSQGSEPAPVESAPAPLSASTFSASSSMSSMASMGSMGGAEPDADDEVWTVIVRNQASGLYSLNRIKSLISAGEIPGDAKAWHPGWSDYQAIASIPGLEAAAKSSPRAGMKIGKSGIVQLSASMQGDEEATDTNLKAPSQGFMGKVKALFAKKKTAPKAAAAAPIAAKKSPIPARKVSSKSSSALRIAGLVAVLAAGGGGAYYYVFLSSPISKDLDVKEEDREAMVEVLKHGAESGHKMFLALATGNPEDPPDPTAPKYYVASSLPEGTPITLTVTGVPGALVNRVSFEKTFTANVEKNHLATFDQIKDDAGKPIWGQVKFKLVAEGAEPLELENRFIGSKGAAYQNRLKIYKESVQGDYDKEVAELREYISTLKSIQADASKQIADYKTNGTNPAAKLRLTNDWGSIKRSSNNFLPQLEAKLKERQTGETAAKHNPRAFQDVATVVGQLDQLIKAHSDQLSGVATKVNVDELDGLLQAGVQGLDSWLSQAVSKTPFDAAPAAAPGAATKPASVPAAAAPATAAPAPLAAAPAAPAAAPKAAPSAPPAAPAGATP